MAALPDPYRVESSNEGASYPLPGATGDLGYAPRTLADRLAGSSFAELEEFAMDVRRRAILELPDANMRKIVKERLEHRTGPAHS